VRPASFIYDLWGDTVNTASRMESHARPGTIQVTERAYERLRELYELRPRGTIEVKGKGSMTANLLLGQCMTIQDGGFAPAVGGPPTGVGREVRQLRS
jgi:adenylate cyclase